jgi:hypothetical protein
VLGDAVDAPVRFAPDDVGFYGKPLRLEDLALGVERPPAASLEARPRHPDVRRQDGDEVDLVDADSAETLETRP